MLPVCFFDTCYSQKQQFVFSTIVQKVSVHCIVYSGKSALNCTSAIKSLLHASVNSLSTIVQKVSVYCIFHTGLNCCLSLFFSHFFVRS
jgi:hypothetical protein